MTSMDNLCPVCEKNGIEKESKSLYGYLVCKRCFYSFANRRQGAFLIDVLIFRLMCYAFAFILGVFGLSELVGRSVLNLPILLIPLFLLKEGISGQSLGKKIMGVQVMNRQSGYPGNFIHSFKRNLPVLIPIMPIIIAVQLCRGYRLGDGWAETQVVWIKHKHWSPFSIIEDGPNKTSDKKKIYLAICLGAIVMFLLLIAIIVPELIRKYK